MLALCVNGVWAEEAKVEAKATTATATEPASTRTKVNQKIEQFEAQREKMASMFKAYQKQMQDLQKETFKGMKEKRDDVQAYLKAQNKKRLDLMKTFRDETSKTMEAKQAAVQEFMNAQNKKRNDLRDAFRKAMRSEAKAMRSIRGIPEPQMSRGEAKIDEMIQARIEKRNAEMDKRMKEIEAKMNSK